MSDKKGNTILMTIAVVRPRPHAMKRIMKSCKIGQMHKKIASATMKKINAEEPTMA